MKKERICWLGFFGGLFFALCTFLGVIYAPEREAAAPGFAVSLAAVCLLIVLYYLILRAVLHREYRFPETIGERGAVVFFRRHIFTVAFFTVLLAWLPYIAYCYPGNVSFDGARQFRQALGTEALANDHPVVGTLLLGFFFRLGRRVNDNFGLFTVISVQTLLAAGAVGACERRILALTDSVRFAFISLIFFALNPVWGMYAQTVVKDTPFTALFLLYSLSYSELAGLVLNGEKPGKIPGKTWAAVIVEGVLCGLIRHEQIAIVFVSLLVLALLSLQERWKVVVLALLTLAVSLGCGKLAASLTKTASPSPREVMSAFFQQTALYMKRFPDDVTPEQYQVINAVLSADEIGDLYDPLLSDPVKKTYRPNAGAKELAAYFKAWWQMFLRHPRVYFDSYSPFWCSYTDPFHYITEKRVFFTAFSMVEGMDLRYPRRTALRKSMTQFTETLLFAPVLQQFINPGTYFWIFAVCLLLLWHKRCFRQMAVLSLPFLQIFRCLTSPAAGYLRYALPLLAVTPLMMAWTAASAARSKTEE